MRWLLACLILVLLFSFFPKLSLAQSEYVLPYPSFMPGNKLYVLHTLWEEITKYWYFGNFGQFTYNLQQSDKYLVEAKTLFEYKQYLFAYKALKKSDKYFISTMFALEKARQSERNVSQKELVLKSAARKHIEIFLAIEKLIPEEFLWQPENAAPSKLDIRKTISQSIKNREKSL